MIKVIELEKYGIKLVKGDVVVNYSGERIEINFLTDLKSICNAKCAVSSFAYRDYSLLDFSSPPWLFSVEFDRNGRGWRPCIDWLMNNEIDIEMRLATTCTATNDNNIHHIDSSIKASSYIENLGLDEAMWECPPTTGTRLRSLIALMSIVAPIAIIIIAWYLVCL